VTRARLGALFTLPGTLWLLALFVIPYGIVVAVALAVPDIVGRPVYGWHTANLVEVVTNSMYLRLLGRSVLFAGLTTVACALLGYPVAYTIARFGGRYRNGLIALVLLPWLVDYLVRIYAWVAILGNEGLINGVLRSLGMHGDPPVRMTNTPYAVILGLVYSYFPLMVMPLYASLEQMDPSLIEAGKDLYGSPRTTFFHVTLPCSIEGLLAGSLLVFLPSMGDFAAARFLGGASTYMMGNMIADQFQVVGDWTFGAALTTVMMTVMWIVIAAFILTRGTKALDLAR
jgi:spermidine/putrescine transport system permease protein